MLDKELIQLRGFKNVSKDGKDHWIYGTYKIFIL